MSEYNPFIDRTVIWDPKRFFGREREVEQIFERLKAMQSVSVVGERRIGKSSLLAFIRATGSDKLGDDYEFHYIDLQGLEDTDDFIQRVLDALDVEGKTRRDLERAIKTRHVILCIDEFEWSANFSMDFFGILRNLASTGNMALLVASKHTLADLAVAGTTTSPFFNIFTSRRLIEMSEAETGELFKGLGRLGERNFSEDEIRAAYKLTDGNPWRLQIFGYHLYEAGNVDEAKHNYRQELKSYKSKTTTPDVTGLEPLVSGLLILAAIIGFISLLTSSVIGIAATLLIAAVGLLILLVGTLGLFRRREA